MEYDDILKKYIGEIGWYQILIVLYVSSVSMSIAFNALDFTLIGITPDYRCSVGNISHLEANLSHFEILRLTSPLKVGGSIGEEYDACYVYERDYSSMTLETAKEISKIAHNLSSIFNVSLEIRSCNSWYYSADVFTRTIVSEWDLVCDKKWLLATSQAVYMVGLFTVCIGGWLSDRFGRKPVAVGSFIIHIIARIAEGMAPDYYVFLVARFFQGVANVNLYMAVFTTVVELVGPKWRILVAQVAYSMWSIGYMILPGVAYFIRDWRTLTLVLLVFSVPYLLFPLLFPESIRWLYVQKRYKEATTQLKQIAKFNKRSIPDNLFQKIEVNDHHDHKSEKGSLCDLFKSRKLIMLTLIQFFLWTSVFTSYYGIMFFLPTLGGNVFITTFISGALEIPSLIYVYFTCDTRLGRRMNCIITFSVCGLAMLILMAIPKEHNWIIITLALLGRFAINASFSIVYMITSEVYPTVLRVIGLSACCTVSRIGGVISPYMAQLGTVSPFLPPTIFSTLCLTSAFLAWFLPETRGTNLPDTIKQVEGPCGKSTSKDHDDYIGHSEMRLTCAETKQHLVNHSNHDQDNTNHTDL